MHLLNILLNKIKLSTFYANKFLLAFTFAVLLISSDCGKRKLPLPPIESVSQRVEISGIQQGNLIIISWTLPERNASADSTLNIARADIYRLAETQNSVLTLSEEEFSSRSTQISTLPISADDFRRKHLTFADTLQFAGQNVRLRYAIRFVNSSGQKAAFSNFLLIEPTAKVAGNPTSLSAKVSEKTILFEWKAPGENVDGSNPPNILGYNLYRINAKINSDDSIKKLNDIPITADKFADNNFEFGMEYKYFVRTISLGGNGEPVESINSNSVAVTPVDIFAPSSPSAITIAAAPNILSIFFAVNPETDIAGYRIYRSSDPNLPKSEWQALTAGLLNTNTYQDKNIERGKTYFYYITAVDTSGNSSEPSFVVSETAP